MEGGHIVGYSFLRIHNLVFWSSGWLYSKIICIWPTILLRCCVAFFVVFNSPLHAPTKQRHIPQFGQAVCVLVAGKIRC